MIRKSKPERKTSKYIGVYAFRDKWMAQIKMHHKNKYLGMFEHEIDAARAYDAAKRDAIEKGLWISPNKGINFSIRKEEAAGVAPHVYIPETNYEEIFKDDSPFDSEVERKILNELGVGEPRRNKSRPIL